jgi:hypothetical protein
MSPTQDTRLALNATQSSAVINDLLLLRIAVAFLGERGQRAWWDTEFLSDIGRQYLRIIFPRTALQASVHSASVAAQRLHDERIGLGRVLHLFRLSHETEFRLHRLALEIDSEQISQLLHLQKAELYLRKTAVKVAGAPGPVKIGPLESALSETSVGTLAGHYLTAFETGQPAFPYFG